MTSGTTKSGLDQDGRARRHAPRASLLATLRTQETSFNADGITGPTDISKHGLSSCFVLAPVRSGQWQRVHPRPGSAPSTAPAATSPP